MVKNNIGVIILVSAIVAVVTSIVTGLIVSNVNLSPPKTISDASDTINAHKCMADGTCEVNELLATSTISTTETVGGTTGKFGDVVIEGNSIHTQYGSEQDLTLQADGGLMTLIGNIEANGIVTVGESLYVQNSIYGLDLDGTGNAYVCVDANGKLYRSQTPCV